MAEKLAAHDPSPLQGTMSHVMRYACSTLLTAMPVAKAVSTAEYTQPSAEAGM